MHYLCNKVVSNYSAFLAALRRVSFALAVSLNRRELFLAIRPHPSASVVFIFPIPAAVDDIVQLVVNPFD